MAENTKIEWADSTKCYGVNPLTGRPGPAPKPPESGNKAQARQRKRKGKKAAGRLLDGQEHNGYPRGAR